MAFTKQALGRLSALLLGIGLLILLLVGASNLYLAQRVSNFADLLIRWQRTRELVTDLYGDLKDAETGQRGYLLTHNDKYLAPYTAAIAKIPALLNKLEPRLATLPDSATSFESLKQTIEQKLAELDQSITLAKQNRLVDALTLVNTDRGKLLMDHARELIGQLTTQVDARRNAERANLSWLSELQLYATWSGLVMILLVTVIATWLVIRYLSESEEAHKMVAAANAGLEARVRERTADLQEANEEIQRFAYIVSHDLRAPLVNVMGFTAELQAALASVEKLLMGAEHSAPDLVTQDMRQAVREDLPEAVDFIRSSTQRMDRLINAILKLSREGRRTLTPEPIKTQDMLRSIAESLQHQLDEAEAVVEVVPPMPDLVSDRLALEQVFGNLIDNAVKYLQPGRPGHVAIRGETRGPEVIYHIQDNGRGIEAKDRERVFELFRRAGAQDRPGEGIGLAHVRALVRRLGGTIDFISQPGQGTTFTLRLPRILVPSANS